jgi:hypothetical protein
VGRRRKEESVDGKRSKWIENDIRRVV